MWDKIVEANISRGGVHDGVLVEGCYEFLRLVTLNSLGLNPKIGEERNHF